ncbi:mitochondrial 37S ribosomal protein MRPS28 [Apiospora rasikravindrae]|uniref:Mitochondrial 37S ribosomal protein MRPS28 n=1 Tax=Apiospora rasikravindrae TaxID=990691 RepID=A0ABR1SYD1_9PEZI
MPPRIPTVPRFGALNLCLRPAPKPASPSLLLPLTQTASLTTKEKKRLAKQDPYRWQQMQQRKAAHNVIKERIGAQKAAEFGDPVRGLTTPFVESFDSAGQAAFSRPPVDDDGNPLEQPHPLPTSPHVLNNLVSQPELDEALQHARVLTQPLAPVNAEAMDPVREQQKAEQHAANHAKAAEALQRIVHIDNGSSKDKRHANIRRCVETFGRHNTDQTFTPKPLARGIEDVEKPIRAGADTGSSEVQIAILTAKIRALANELEKGRGYKDKVGKRDLRLMVHKRAKLLKYMARKERGSERWTHMIETLGLSPATYQREITL